MKKTTCSFILEDEELQPQVIEFIFTCLAEKGVKSILFRKTKNPIEIRITYLINSYDTKILEIKGCDELEYLEKLIAKYCPKLHKKEKNEEYDFWST